MALYTSSNGSFILTGWSFFKTGSVSAPCTSLKIFCACFFAIVSFALTYSIFSQLRVKLQGKRGKVVCSRMPINNSYCAGESTCSYRNQNRRTRVRRFHQPLGHLHCSLRATISLKKYGSVTSCIKV